MRAWGAIGLALMLGACAARLEPPAGQITTPPRSEQPRQPVAATPLPPQPMAPANPGAADAGHAGVVAGPPIASLPIAEQQAARAITAFRLSCRELIRAGDLSGLTRAADWQPACDAAATPGQDARGFLARWFETVQIGDGRAFATGYYIPEIAGARDRRPGYDVPVYGRPTDLIDVDLGQFSTALKGKSVRGRVQGTKLVPYDDRAAIEGDALAGRAPVIAWAADSIEFFFLQVQGSGILRLPDGGTLRIGYASQNGRDYTGIGALMKARGLIGPGQTSMQGIVQWLRDHPDQAKAIMDENKSYVFFRLLDGPPLGAMGLAVTGGATVAADPKFVPLGAPVFLSMDRTDATGLWVAQDTGGAIRGANRFDTFWGAGADARAIAGGMSARGTAWVLVPVGTLARLQAGGAGGGAAPQP